MAYNEKLADRVRELIASRTDKTEEKLMFGGMCFMVNNKMCVAVKSDRIMVRLDPAIYEEVMQKDGTLPMIHSGKEVQGFLYVTDDQLNTKTKLQHWVELALDYNSKAKASKTSTVKKKTAAPKRSPGKKRK